VAHASGAEPVTAAGMLHRNAVIQRDLQECLAVTCFDSFDLAGVVEGDASHNVLSIKY